jgi:hypothetical protein
MTHSLKTWPEYYKAVESGAKNFEVRRNDRPFKVGDTLLLQEWDNIRGMYTGEEVRKEVTYILKGSKEFGVSSDFVVMGLKDVPIQVSFVLSVGRKFKSNKAEDLSRFKCHVSQISAYCVPENKLWINGHQHSIFISEFVQGLDNGRFEIVE